MLQTYAVGLLQAKAYRRLKNYMSKQLLEFDLTMPQWAFLGLVFESKSLRLSYIAEMMEVEAPFATAMADQMYNKGFINRIEDKVDRRAKLISLTETGKRLVPNVEKGIKNAMRKIYKNTSPEELGVYIKVLNAIATVYSETD